MSTIKSSAENLTLNADGANNDIIFQSNGSNVATLDQAGLLTATTFAGSGASLTALNATNLGSGTVPTARLGSGTASSSTFLRGDSTYAEAGGNAPYFEAKNSSTQTPTDGAWTKMDMDTEILDSGGMFASGRFTPTVAGKYLLTLIGQLSGQVNTSFYQGDIGIYKNGSGHAYAGIDQSSNYGKTAVFSVVTIVDMNGSSDYVEAWGNMNDAPGAGGRAEFGSNCRFLGYKIG